MQRPDRPYARLLLYSFLLALVFLGSIFPITDNDVWWHLETGEYIWQHKAVPRVDVFSYTIAGRPWTAFEWLAQLALFGVFQLCGLAGLTVFKALVVACIFLLMLKSVREGDALSVWIFLGLAFLGMRDGLRERPQLFTYFFCSLFLYLLRTKNAAGLAALPFIEVVWVNMHGPAALAGFGLAALYALFSRGMRPLLRAYLVAGTAAALFVNPNSWRVLSYLYTFFRDGFNRLILEYQPPVLSAGYVPYFLLLALSVTALLLPGKKERTETLVLVIACAASLAAIRNIPLFAVLAAPLAADRFSQWRKTRLPFPAAPSRCGTAALAGAFLFSSFWFAGGRLDVAGKYAPGIGDAHRCRFAARFLADSRAGGRLFNDYDLGGYLIRALYPGARVFVDGRLVEYGAPFVEKSFYYWKPEVWDELEGRYAFTAAVIPQERFYAASYLDRRKDWVLVWWDDGALVYLKDVPENRTLVRTFGYRFLKPNSPRQDYLRSLPLESVRAELARALYYAPQSNRARSMQASLEKRRS